tara:strand:- start:46372 stop:47541 length:1170 start_codon:yes stop_codon:yes gene_type:complete
METKMITKNEVKDREQKKALNAWAKAGFVGSIIAGTGYGKSRCGVLAAAYILGKDKETRGLVLVPTTQLKDQFTAEFAKWGKEDVLPQLEVVCYQSAYKLKNEQYDIVICDEVHMGLSPKYRRFFENNTYKSLLCMTATMPEEPEYCTLLQKLAPTNYRISLDECVSLGLVSPYEIHCIPVELTKKERKDYIDINNKFVYWSYQLGPNAFDEAKWALSSSSSSASSKHAAAQFYNSIRKRKKIVDFAQRKKTALKKIVKKAKGAKILVFSGANAFTDILAKATAPNSTTYHSKKSKKQRELAIKEFKDGTKTILCSTKALNQGFDVPDAGIGVICGLTSKSLSMVQRVGRLIRFQEGKVGKIYILYTKDSQEEKWLKNSIKNLNNVKWL